MPHVRSCSGMFTANSMNCLTEALGLSLPGNGSTLATHAARKELFLEAGRTIVGLAKRYYEDEDDSVAPRSIATKAAFSNAMALDVAMGGSTNTVLHILAAAQEGASTSTSPTSSASAARCRACQGRAEPPELPHGGRAPRRRHPALLGELDRAGLLDHDVTSVHADAARVARRLGRPGRQGDRAGRRAVPRGARGVRTTQAFSTSNRWESLDTDAANGCIRDLEHAYTVEGGLAVLRGNLAEDGAVFKTAGVDPDVFHFVGTALVCESQDEAVEKILTKQVEPGHVVVVRYEGPRAARACRRCCTRRRSSRVAGSAR